MGKRSKPEGGEEETNTHGQLLLMPLPEPHEGAELLLPAEERAARYPCSTVDRDSERLQGIIDELGKGRPKNWICKTYRVGHDTLLVIERRHGPKIGELKRRLASKLLYTCDLIADQVQAAAAKGELDPDKAAITLGVFAEKALLLTGDATVIHGSAEATKEFSVETLRARLGGRRVIDVSSTGSAGGKPEQTRELAAAPTGEKAST